MYYKLFVKNLTERIFHIAIREAEGRDYILRQTGLVGSTTVLMLSCNDPFYLPHLANTLETDSKIEVLAIKDSYDRLIDFRNIPETLEAPFFNRHTLSISRERAGTRFV